MDKSENSFEGWVILELMGHRRLAGYLSEQVVGGAAFLRIDVPHGDDGASTSQFYSASAVYCITPTTEELARRVAKTCAPRPVSTFELPAPDRNLNRRGEDDDDDDADEY